MTVANIGDEAAPEIVGCTGSGDRGGLTIFHRHLPKTKRRRLNLEPCERIFSVKVNGAVEHLWASTDDTTNVYEAGTLSRVEQQSEATIFVSAFLNHSLVLQVMPTSLRLLDSSHDEIQRVRPNTPTPLCRASVVDRYVLLERKDRTPLLYEGDATTRSLSKVPLPEVSISAPAAPLSPLT